MLKSRRSATKYAMKKQAKKLWLFLLAFVVVASTSLALSLKAITLDYDPLSQDGAGTSNGAQVTENGENGDSAENSDLADDGECNRQPSIELQNANETIGLELQASGTAVSNAADLKGVSGKTVYLSADITISDTVTIGGNTTLDLNGYKIVSTGDNLFEINSGSLTIKDTVTDLSGSVVDGMPGKTSTYSNGVLTYYVTKSEVTDVDNGLTKETWYKYTTSSKSAGQAGAIIGGDDSCRAVKVNGGTFTLESGIIANFKSSNGPAIYASGGTVNIKGGVITGNTASAGGGGIFTSGQNTTLNISGGYITNNKNTATGYFDGGGGIRISSKSKLNLSGGDVTANYSACGGGGISTAADWGTPAGGSGYIYMTGGQVSSNHANKNEGGGINVNAGGFMSIKNVTNAAFITNNSAGNGAGDTNFEDWGGGGIFCAQDGAILYIEKALITNNNAGGYGGGVAGCATGRITIVPDNGAGIFDNSAEGTHMSGNSSTKREDIEYAFNNEVFRTHGYQDYFCALSTSISGEMPGGGAALWNGSSDGVPVATLDSSDVITGTYVTGLTCEANDDAKAGSRALANVYITGNSSSTHGGGILVNGHMVIGQTTSFNIPARIELQAKKRLYGADGIPMSMKNYDFKFRVEDEYGNDVAIATADAGGTLAFDRMLGFDKEGTYKYIFYELPSGDPEVRMDTSVYELNIKISKNKVGTVPGLDTINKYQYLIDNVKLYDITKGQDSKVELYNGDPGDDDAKAVKFTVAAKDSDIAFKNRIVDKETPLEITVNKKWTASVTTKPASVKVALFRDGEQVGEPVTLNAGNGWKYTFTGLKNDATYKVKEVGSKDFYANYRTIYDDVTENVTGVNNNAILCVKDGDVFKPTKSIQSGKQYIIVNPNKDQALMITSAHQDSPFTAADTVEVTKSSSNVVAEGIPDNAIFKQDTNNGRVLLKAVTTDFNSWLLLEDTGGTFLKGTTGAQYGSKMLFNGDYLSGYKNQDTSGTSRYIVWDGSKFTSSTTNIEKGEKVTLVRDASTITNQPLDEVRWSLNVQKTNSDSTPLSGATFEIRQNSTDGKKVAEATTGTTGRLNFTGLAAGTYYVVETKAPTGYVIAAPKKVEFGADSESLTTTVNIVDQREGDESYELPETGGPGTIYCYLAGALMIAIACLKTFKRKKV